MSGKLSLSLGSSNRHGANDTRILWLAPPPNYSPLSAITSMDDGKWVCVPQTSSSSHTIYVPPSTEYCWLFHFIHTFLCIDVSVCFGGACFICSGQIIATSHDRFPPNGGLVIGKGHYSIWPDLLGICWGPQDRWTRYHVPGHPSQ